MNSQKPISVLFVCMGNICRSPTAEATFNHAIKQAGVAAQFFVDSAGTHAGHVGHPPDSRSVAVAEAHGIDMGGMMARRVTTEDFHHFDHIIAMDGDNLRILEQMQPQDGIAQLSLLLSHDPEAQDTEVPDPYYGGKQGFELVFDWVGRATQRLAENLVRSV